MKDKEMREMYDNLYRLIATLYSNLTLKDKTKAKETIKKIIKLMNKINKKLNGGKNG